MDGWKESKEVIYWKEVNSNVNISRLPTNIESLFVSIELVSRSQLHTCVVHEPFQWMVI